MDWLTLIQQMQDQGIIRLVATNPLAQFGPGNRRYVGAELLPERPVDVRPGESYRETQIRYRTIFAVPQSRYSPPVKVGGDIKGDFLVELGTSGLKRELTSRDFDAINRLVQAGNDLQAMAQLTQWLDTTIVRAHAELVELQRWQALVDGQVIRQGITGYSETVTYPNPAGHRVNAGGVWGNDAYDPFDDIYAMVDLLTSKGYTVGRIITSRKVVSIMAGNTKVQSRVGAYRLGVATTMRASLAAINAALNADGLPPIETYDLQTRTETGTQRFLADNAMVFAAATGRDETVDLGDSQQPLILPDTLGYSALGIVSGQSTPGRYINQRYNPDYPPSLVAEGVQETLPVILEPEAYGVIKNISAV